MTVVANIGYESKFLNTSGILSYYPLVLELESFADLRAEPEINELWKWSERYHVTPSSITLFLTIGKHNLTVRMMNVREYRKKWEDEYEKEWTFDRPLKNP